MRFSPRAPNAAAVLLGTERHPASNAQREFYALDLERRVRRARDAGRALVGLGDRRRRTARSGRRVHLLAGQRCGLRRHLAPGVRLVTFAPILKQRALSAAGDLSPPAGAGAARDERAGRDRVRGEPAGRTASPEFGFVQVRRWWSSSGPRTSRRRRVDRRGADPLLRASRRLGTAGSGTSGTWSWCDQRVRPREPRGVAAEVGATATRARGRGTPLPPRRRRALGHLATAGSEFR